MCSLSKNLNMLSSIGFGLDPEATEILVKQLEQLYTEDKLLREFLPNTDLGLNLAGHWGQNLTSGLSQRPSGSTEGVRITPGYSKKKQRKKLLKKQRKEEKAETHCHEKLKMMTELNSKSSSSSESSGSVCSKGKSGGALLLDEFQKAMAGMEGSAVACNCIGKC
ncbi:hypothetical protein HID58_018427 [Brassica napus]|uniref:Uncharacterized protein n=1 Tax=Brassica napus TaxID=3708 RepID=A0ABQ8D9Y2_BRANA|nr:hypothetical protein HID58_018427 [Brassica napus]